MAVDHGRHVEAPVPVGGEPCTAPLGELGVPQDVHRFAHQGPVAGDDQRDLRIVCLQAPFGLRHPRPAPGLAARVRVGVQQELVGAHHPCPARVRQGLLLGRGARRPEAVVVQHEHGRHGHRPAGSGPQGVRVLRGAHPEAPAQLDQVLVALLAPQPDRIALGRPQLVVPRGPDHPPEAAREQPQRPLHVRHPLRDITGDDQPVLVRSGPQGLDEGTVVRHPRMKVTHRQQGAGASIGSIGHPEPSRGSTERNSASPRTAPVEDGPNRAPRPARRNWRAERAEG